jgi:hypothetical protein
MLPFYQFLIIKEVLTRFPVILCLFKNINFFLSQFETLRCLSLSIMKLAIIMRNFD